MLSQLRIIQLNNGGKKTLDIENMPKSLIMILISVLFAVALIPTIITQWQGVDTTGWNFTGHEGAVILWGLAPFILIAGIILSFVVALVFWKKGGLG